MSEFKLTGDGYISQWNGSPSNDGTDPDTPWQNVNQGPAGALTVVVGSGYYIGTSSIVNRSYLGDGNVIIDMNGSPINFGSTLGRNFKNIWIKNASLISARGDIEDSIIEESNLTNSVGGGSYYHIYRSVLIHSGEVINLSNATKRYWDSLILSNINHLGQTLNGVDIRGSYLVKGKKIIIGSANNLILLNSMINGVINFNGVDYELKKLINGEPRPDADPSVADIISILPNVYTTNGNYAGEAKILDVVNKIVAPDSDLLKRIGVYGVVGSVKPGVYYSVDGNTDYDVVLTDINSTTPSNVTIASGEDEGFVDYYIKVSESIVQMPIIHLDTLLAFDGSVAGGTAGNNNVPDIFPTNYSPLSQVGLKPNRLTYQLRTSKSVIKPTTDAQWDNDFDVLGTVAGAFYVQEISKTPTISDILTVKYGNGNKPDGTAGTENTINARWAHVKIRFTNLRSFV